MSTRVETSRELDVPVETAYAQWTQFEDMKLYMDGVESARQLRDDLLRVTFQRRGVERTWDARITEQIPNARIAWESDSEDPEHAGVVTFHRIDDTTSKVLVQLDFWPTGFFEHYADKTGLIERYVEDALDGYAAFIEDRKRPTGSWDGIIGRDDLSTSDDSSAERTTSGTSTEPTTAGTSTEPTTGDTSRPGTVVTPTTPPSTPAPATTSASPSDGNDEVRTMADGEIVVDDDHRTA